LNERGINGRLYGRNIIHVYFGPLDFEPSDDTMPPTKDIQQIMNPAMTAIKTRLNLHLLQRGIATLGGRFFILSAVHTEEDIDKTIEAFGSTIDSMVTEGMLKTA